MFKANTIHHFKTTTVAKQGWGKDAKMVKISEVQAQAQEHRLMFFPSIKGPALIPLQWRSPQNQPRSSPPRAGLSLRSAALSPPAN